MFDYDETITFFNDFKAMCNSRDCQKCPLYCPFKSCDILLRNEPEKLIDTVKNGVKKMKKINQKRFIKLSRRFYSENDIKRVIIFMREHNGFISYLDFVVILSMHKLNLDNTLTYLTHMFRLGVSQIETSINGGI